MLVARAQKKVSTRGKTKCTLEARDRKRFQQEAKQKVETTTTCPPKAKQAKSKASKKQKQAKSEKANKSYKAK